MTPRRATSIATVSPPLRPPRSRRRGAAPARALLGVVVLALSGTLAPGLGHAAGAAPAQADPTVMLTGQTSWVTDESPFTVDLRVAGAPEGAAVDMVVHDYLESRSQFRDTLDGDLGPTTRTIAPRALAGLPSPAPGTVQMGFTPADALRGQGVYPVEVRLLDSGGDPVASVVTYLSYFTADDEFPPLDVAVVVDIAAPPALQTDGSYAMSAESIEHARQRIDAVGRAGDAQVTLAPRPETIEGLVGEGGGESPDVDDLRSLAAGRQVLARPFVDVDLASLRDAGLLPEANSQAEGGADVVRSRLAVEPAGGVWLSGTTWGADAAQQAVDLGIGRAVVPPTAVGDGTAGQDVPTTPVRLGGDAGPLALVTDPDLAAHLTGDEGMVAAHRFLAELAITWREAPSDPRAVVVHLPASGAIDPEVVGAALAGLAGGPALRGVPVTQIFDEVAVAEDGPSPLELAPHPDGPDLRSLAPALESVRGRVAGVGSLLDDPEIGAGLEHSLLLSTGTDTPGDDRRAYVQRADDALNLVSGAVSLPDEFRITLTTRSSTIPVTVSNNLDQNLSVRIELDSDQLEFPDGAVIEQVLPPGTTRVEVPVRARTSGAFTMDVRVTSRDQTIVLDTSTFDIRSTAISGVGLVLSVGAGLFLAVWWARNWRKTRRTRRGAGGGSDDPDPIDGPGGTGDEPDADRSGLGPPPVSLPGAGAATRTVAVAPAPTGSTGPLPSRPPPPGPPPVRPAAPPGPRSATRPRPWAPPSPTAPPPWAARPAEALPADPAPAPPAPDPGRSALARDDDGTYRPAHMASPRSGRRLPVGPSRRPPGRDGRSS